MSGGSGSRPPRVRGVPAVSESRPTEPARRRVVVHGHVQGVFYRASARDRARELGVSGWIANRPDGSVEAVFEGRPESVDALVAWCREGSGGAAVSRVEEFDEATEGLSGFAVR